MSEEIESNSPLEPSDDEVKKSEGSLPSSTSDPEDSTSNANKVEASSTLPPPIDPLDNLTEASTDRKRLVTRGRLVSVGAIAIVIVLLAGFLLIGGGSGDSPTSEYEYFATDDEGEIYFASLNDDQVVVSSRLGDSVRTITYYESLSSLVTQEMIVVSLPETYYVWNNDEISEISKQTLTSRSLFRGQDIGNVFFIGDSKTLLVNDDSNCFAIPLGKQPTRIASGDCEIVGGRIFTLDTSSDNVILNEVTLEGESINRFTLELNGNISIHKSGRMISGISNASQGNFEVYSTTDGKRMYAAQSDEILTILDEALESSEYLVTIENEELDEKLDVGVLSFADGSGVFTELDSVYSAQGWISPDGTEVLMLSRASQDDTERDLHHWEVGVSESQLIVAGIEELLDYKSDNQQRVALLTSRELIVGAFDNSFTSRTSGNFEYNSALYFQSNGILAELVVNDKVDLVYVKNGPADDSGNQLITLTTAANNVYVYNSSLVVEGYVYYAEESNNYLELYRQSLTDGQTRERVAEGRISRLTVLPDGKLFYSESDGDRYISYVQNDENPENRVQVSDRYDYFPSQITFNTGALYVAGPQYREEGFAQIDADVKRCRDLNAPFVATGTTAEFTLTRVNNSSYDMALSDYKFFCVRNAEVVTVVSATRADGNNDYMRWVGLDCVDSEGSDVSDRSNLNSGDVTVVVGGGVLVCGLHDWNDYFRDYDSDLGEYIDPIRGMTVTLSVQ